jgi:serine/threonine protein kinase
MQSSDWQKVKTIFHDALDLSAEERAAFLSNACDGDDDLRREVETLLDADESAGDFIVSSALVEAGVIENEISLVGKRIGRYEILEELGRGGMGTVYLAVRADDEYKKKVAIKLIKRGMDTDAILKRFRNERQILAGLEHPNIARLLDGGTTEDGLPYFVMEYIEGLPITKHCDNQNLNTNERLKLFRQVCSAVQYSHQNLVVHRDIKPSNIIVTKDGTPKLLDFGIAKLLNPDWSADTIEQTASMMLLMTPEYASPEQIRGLPITTATDVYSLGVVLYELLSGHRPFKIKNLSHQEIIQAILSEEPLKPSQQTEGEKGRWGDGETAKLRDEKTARSNKRVKNIFPFSLSPHLPFSPSVLRGDIDNIVLKAIRKEPMRRYTSVQEFSEDIRRHLEGLPVTARADTFGYRTSKFVQRHKAGVAAALLIFVTLLSATVITAWQARVARREKEKAEKRFNQVRKLANLVLFEYHDGIERLPGSTPVREKMVKDALEYLDNLSAESGGDASLQSELATAYLKVGDIQGNPYYPNLGDMSGALASYQKALAIRETLVAVNPKNAKLRRELANSYSAIADVFWAKGDNAGALENYKKALAIDEALANENPSDKSNRNALADRYYYIGQTLRKMGDSAGALENFRKALEINEEFFSAEPTNANYCISLATSYLKIGDVFYDTENYSEALNNHQKAVELLEPLAKDKTDAFTQRSFAMFLNRVAADKKGLGDLKDAIDTNLKAIAIQKQLVEADSKNEQYRLDLANLYHNLGDSFLQSNKIAEAIDYLKKAIAIFNDSLAKNPDYMEARQSLNAAYKSLGDALMKAGNKNAETSTK